MRLLIKELEPTAGTIRVAGRDLAEITRASTSRTTAATSASSSRTSSCCPNRTVYDNVAYALQVTGGTRKEIRDEGAGHPAPHRPVARSCTTTPTSSPAASSSASSSRARSSTTRRCCWPTSRPATSTPRRRSGSCSCSTASTAPARPCSSPPTTRDGRPDAPPRDRAHAAAASCATRRPACTPRDETTARVRRAAARARARRSRPHARRERVRRRFATTCDEARLLPRARRCARSARNADPELRRDGVRARHGARARRLHPVVQATTGAANEVRGRVLVDVYLKTRRQASRHRTASARCSHDTPTRRAASSSSPRHRPTRRRSSATPRPTSCSAPTRCRTPSASRPTSPTTSLKLARRARAARRAGRRPHADRPRDRRGQEPQGRHDEDPHRHARREADDGRCWRCCSIVASILLISNTIRLSLFSRRREVEVMKLVGATDWFIRWPFVIEGIVLGALGGAARGPAARVGKIALARPAGRRTSR